MESDRRGLKARARALFIKSGPPLSWCDSALARALRSSSGPSPFWTESEKQTWHEIDAMAPHERIQFNGEVLAEAVPGIARRARLEALRLLNRLRSNREVIQSSTFEEWFWARCRRLGIDEEFRAK